MSANPWTRVDPKGLYQPFARRIERLAAACEDLGALYVPTSGLRTYAEQDALYAQGRTAPGKVVTRARGGESLHNHGIAVDLTRDHDIQAAGIQPDWNSSAYEVLAEQAEKLGLEAGLHWVSFQDPPHIQMPIEKYSVELSDLRDLYAAGGYAAVFDFMDRLPWWPPDAP